MANYSLGAAVGRADAYRTYPIDASTDAPTYGPTAFPTTDVEMADTASPTDRPTIGLVWRGDGHKSSRIVPPNAAPLDRRCVPRPFQVRPRAAPASASLDLLGAADGPA